MSQFWVCIWGKLFREITWWSRDITVFEELSSSQYIFHPHECTKPAFSHSSGLKTSVVMRTKPRREAKRNHWNSIKFSCLVLSCQWKANEWHGIVSLIWRVKSSAAWYYSWKWYYFLFLPLGHKLKDLIIFEIFPFKSQARCGHVLYNWGGGYSLIRA